MVGTNATRSPSLCQARTRSRTAAIVVTVSIWGGSELVLRCGILAFPDSFDVVCKRLLVRPGSIHEVAYEARLAPRCYVENVIQDENLTVSVGTCANAYHGHLQRLGNLLAQRRWNAFEQHDIRAG